jgi:uncharacterized protein YegP (UPF0339 family)
MEHIEYYQEEQGDWRWRVKADNSKIVGASTEGYRRRIDAEVNLRSLMAYCRPQDIRIAADTKERPADAIHPLEFYEDDKKLWRWRVKARNGNIVHASSEGFADRGNAVNNLEVLMRLVVLS